MKLVTTKPYLTFATAVLLLSSCSKDDSYNQSELSSGKKDEKQTSVIASKRAIKVFKAFGDSSDIAEGLITFRNEAGEVLNTAPGAVGGRREINWDGVPEALTNNNLFPGNFFAAVDPSLPIGRKRGITFLNFDGFRNSDNNFADIDPSYANEFKAFSPKKTFMPAHSNFMEAQFKVPGTNLKAYVESFGVLFTDVETGTAATIELFDERNESIGVFMAHPQTGRGKFSFLGIKIPGGKISRVVIKSGQSPLGHGEKDISSGGMYDLVVMDDFIYSEPVALD